MRRGKYPIVICLFSLLGVASAHAADLPMPKTRPAPAAQGSGLPANCQEWTDGCRVCARQKDGSDACSNVGIACMPEKARCTRP